MLEFTWMRAQEQTLRLTHSLALDKIEIEDQLCSDQKMKEYPDVCLLAKSSKLGNFPSTAKSSR